MLASQQIFQRAKQNHARHYLSKLQLASQELAEQQKQKTSTDLIDHDWSQIVQAQKWLNVKVEHHELVALYSRCVLDGETILQRKLSLTDQARWLLTAYEAAVRLKQPTIQMAHLLKLGRTYTLLGDKSQAEETLSQALAIAKKAQDLSGLAQVYYQTAFLYWYTGQLDKALDAVDAALEVFDTLGDSKLIGHAYLLRGRIQSTIGDLELAETYLMKALHTYQRIHFVEGMARAHMMLASNFVGRCQVSRLEHHAAKGLQLYSELQDINGMGNCYRQLAQAHRMNGDLTTAVRLGQKAVEIHQELGILFNVAHDQLFLGMVAFARCDIATAKEYMLTALQIFEEHDILPGQVYVTRSLGRIFLEFGALTEAKRWLLLSLELGRQINNIHSLIASLCWLAMLNKKQTKLEKAYSFINEATHLIEDATDIWSRWLYQNTRAELALAAGNYEEAEKFYRQSVKFVLPIVQHIELVAYVLLGWGKLLVAQGKINCAYGILNKLVQHPAVICPIKRQADEMLQQMKHKLTEFEQKKALATYQTLDLSTIVQRIGSQSLPAECSSYNETAEVA